MLPKAILTAALALIAGITVTAVPAAVSPRPTRSIKGGTVIGKATPVVSVSSTTTVYNYLGIPFAAAPTGTLRFQPPKTSITLSAPVQATAFPPSCLQSGGNFANSTFVDIGPSDSEDCLYLNIFAPTDASSTSRKPVLFWLFGGNLAYGNSAVNYYNGSSFAGFQDVVVVTINYRTNIFGFSNSPQIPLQSRNAGYLDQRAALDWVQANIASFGGDPTKVTIFGQSAGGYSVKQLFANPPSPLTFRAGIIESSGLAVSGNGTNNFQNVAYHFGCEFSSAGDLACLQNQSAADILSYVKSSSLGFFPAEDNVTQTYDVRSNVASKKWANLPYMIGSNADEFRVFVDMYLGENYNLQTYLDLLYFYNETRETNIKNAYASYIQSTNNDFIAASRILSDNEYTCPSGLLANLTVANGYSNVWRYYYNASFPDLSFFPQAGAYHTSEIPQVFGTYQLQNNLGSATPNQEGLSRYMQTAWANFAKNPSNGPGWTRASASVGNLGELNATGEVTVPAYRTDQYCYVFDNINQL